MKTKKLVSDGYDRVSLVYRSDEGDGDHNYAGWVDELCSELGQSPRILDLGCGCGVPATKLLAARARVIGVDFSHVQIARARNLVREAEFICEDMTTVEFAAASFDAVVSFYAIIHVPLEEQQALLARIAGWLKVGGSFMATLGAHAWTGTEEKWLGIPDVTMYWSYADSATYRSWLEDVGFSIIRDTFVPEGRGGHQLFFARRTV